MKELKYLYNFSAYFKRFIVIFSFHLHELKTLYLLQVSAGLQEVKSWLISKSQAAETDLSNISSPSELSKVKAKFQTIKENIEQKSEAFNIIVKLGK